MVQRQRRQRGTIDQLPSGSFRVCVYAGVDPLTRRRHTLQEATETRAEAERVRVKLLSQIDERRQPRSKATLGMLLDRWLEVVELGEGFVYLAVVVDALHRKVIGWAMADHLRTVLVLDAVGMAITTRKPPTGTVHHTDRGTQYTSYEFGKALRASGLLASMGRVGSAFDNAMAESVFATLKTELIYRRSWPTRHELEMEVFSYLEGFYNTRRRHSRLGNLSPTDYENIHLTPNEVSA